jgi:vacuolar-type H+-ATPase subunit C/Vma6
MGERSYAYAKACGIMGKSFAGKRIHSLEKAGRIADLDRMLFQDAAGTLPEKELLADLEDRITGRATASIISVLEGFSRPPEFLVLLIRGYEYADLISAINALMDKEKKPPFHADLGKFQTVRFNAWPDLKAMIKGTEFDFLLDEKNIPKDGQGTISLQSVLEKRYYAALWKSLLSLPARHRLIAQRILSDEIALKNCSWALRLRVYYEMRAEEVKPHLIDLNSKDAVGCLDFPLDDYSSWSKWRWKDFLPAPQAGGQWRPDPRYFQNAASRHLQKLARRYFHSRPSSLDTIFCFIKLKQFEEDVLTSSAEGLGIGMSVREIISELGVEL